MAIRTCDSTYKPTKPPKPEASRPTVVLLGTLHIFLIFILLSAPQIARQTHRARIIPDFQCPLQDYTSTLCAGPKDCFYARAGNCVEFVECRWTLQARRFQDIVEGRMFEVGEDDDIGFQSEAVIHRCPRDDSIRLEWNDIKKRCDYPGTRGTCGTPGTEGGESDLSMKGDGDVEWRSLDGRITSHKALVKWMWQNARKKDGV